MMKITLDLVKTLVMGLGIGAGVCGFGALVLLGVIYYGG